MTPQPTSNKRKSINLDNVTLVEKTQFALDNDPSKTLLSGITVHFIGGSAVRLVGAEAAEIAAHFSLS